MSELLIRRVVAGMGCLMGIAWVCFISYALLMSVFSFEGWMNVLLFFILLAVAIPGFILGYYGIQLWKEAQILPCLRIVSTSVTLVVFFACSNIADRLEGFWDYAEWSGQLVALVALLVIGFSYFFISKKLCEAVGLGELSTNQIVPRWLVGVLMFQFAVVLWALGEDFLIKGRGIIEVSAGTRFLVTFGPMFLGFGGYQFFVHKLRIEKNGPHRSFQLTK